MIYPGIRSEIGSAIRTAHDRVTGGISLDAQFAAFMAALTAPRILLDPSRAASRFQDVAGSILVTAEGQSFARLNDASGAGNHVGQATAVSMPLYRTDGTLHWAAADGSNDSWYSLANLDLSSTDKIELVLGLRMRGTATGVGLELGPNANTTNGTFFLATPDAGTACTFKGRGTAAVGLGFTLVKDAISVIHCSMDIAAGRLTVRVNNQSEVVSTESMGTGNLISAVLNLFRRNNASIQSFVDFFGLVLIGRLLTSDERLLCRRWMGSKTGVVL